MTITSVRIEKWGNQFVVVGEFRSHSIVARHIFDSYLEAVRMMTKLVKREEVRYEADPDRGLDR